MDLGIVYATGEGKRCYGETIRSIKRLAQIVRKAALNFTNKMNGPISMDQFKSGNHIHAVFDRGHITLDTFNRKRFAITTIMVKSDAEKLEKVARQLMTDLGAGFPMIKVYRRGHNPDDIEYGAGYHIDRGVYLETVREEAERRGVVGDYDYSETEDKDESDW